MDLVCRSFDRRRRTGTGLARLERLRREVKRLEEENLILRKAAAVFAKGIA